MAASHDARASELRTLALAVAVYALVTAIKIAAFFATSMLALLAEGLHTLSDVLMSTVLWVALRYSRKGPDAAHPFGHGRAEYVGALVAATLFISCTSLELIREAIPRLIHPSTEPVAHLPVGIGVLVVSMVLAAIPLFQLWGRVKGEAARAQLVELINDQLGLVAALTGAILVWCGYRWADPVAALVVAVIIGANGIVLFRDNLSLLLGRAPAPHVVARIGALAMATPGVRGLHGLRAEVTGSEVFHAELHVEVDRGQLVEEAHAIADSVERRVRAEFPGSQITVHIDVHDAARERMSDPP